MRREAARREQKRATLSKPGFFEKAGLLRRPTGNEFLSGCSLDAQFEALRGFALELSGGLQRDRRRAGGGRRAGQAAGLRIEREPGRAFGQDELQLLDVPQLVVGCFVTVLDVAQRR